MITGNTSTALFTLKGLSHQDWADFGVNDMAYLKPVKVEGEPRYSIHAANGVPLAVMDTREVAAAAVVQNELEALSVH